ncbi:MAG: NAD-dependent epimerase/dehydratase family protein [Alphaproteobacteria bacterium]|nr:NAD-dependent epimerase/dehydratase family protein [Alphaproteobacteria bacterium]
MILVTGASGATGVHVIRQMARRGAEVRALSHSQAGADRVRAAGAREVAMGDMRVANDFARALAGIDIVYHIYPALQEDEDSVGIRIVEQARRAGVRRFVFHSVIRPQIEAMPYHWKKMRVEEALFASGMPYVVLQPSMYMQNIRGEWPAIVKDGVYARYFSPHRKMNVVDLDDVGEAAAIAVTGDRLDNGVFELGGPDSLTHAEMAGILTRVLGRPVRAEGRPVEDGIAAMKARGVPAYTIDNFAVLSRVADALGVPGNGVVHSAIIGRPLARFEDFARKFAKEMGA